MRVLIALVFLGLLVGVSDCGSNPDDPNNPDGKGDATLAELAVVGTTLTPAFSPTVTAYAAPISSFVDAVQVTARPTDAAATIQVNGMTATAGTPSAPISLQSAMTDITINVTAPKGATKSYVITATKLQNPADYFKASNANGGDRFGFSLSLSGDTLVVGAYQEASGAIGINGAQGDNSATGAGAVYVFRRSGTTWMQEAYLKASNTGAGDFFGYSVSIDGDMLAVGAPAEDSNATGVGGAQNNNSAMESGAVYVFRRSGTTWTQDAYIKASNAEANDAFGDSVSLSGNTLAVGADLEASNSPGINGTQSNNGALASGAVYVFTRGGTTWTQQAYIKASNPNTGDQFGISLGLSGDTLAVGASQEESNATGINGSQSDNSVNRAGAVYVFTRAGTTWTQQAYVKASNTGTGDSFGYRLALAGDTLAVGANGESSNAKGIAGSQSDNSVAGAGAVYVFTRAGTTWTQQAYIKSSNTAMNQFFGSSLALSGDSLAVGATGESSNATLVNGNQTDTSQQNAGAVYLFRRSGTTWAQQAYVKASNTGPDDAFGNSVALSSELLIAGAPNEAGAGVGINTGDQQSNGATQAGAVYVIR